MKSNEVYSFGVIATSSLYLIEHDYPDKAGYAEIKTKYKNIGGEAANSSIVLARLGVKVKIDGNWINPDDDAEFFKDVFNTHEIDISRISYRKCQGPKEMVVVDANSRTIFGTYGQLMEEKSWNIPKKTDIEKADVVCLDPFFGEASLRVAELAKLCKKPVVTVDVKFDDPIFLASSIVIISEEFLRDKYPGQKTETLIRSYHKHTQGTVIVTFGDKEIYYASQGEKLAKTKPYNIKPVDTAGAGDSFRAGLIYGTLKHWPIVKCIEFASALAAMVCQSSPGVLNSPSYKKVESFMREYK